MNYIKGSSVSKSRMRICVYKFILVWTMRDGTLDV